MKALNYLFFWFIIYYQKEKNLTRQIIFAFINVLALISLNLLSIIFLFSTFLKFSLYDFLLTKDDFYNRFILIPLYLFPLALILFVYYRYNRKKITDLLNDYLSLKSEQKQKHVVLYLIFSACLLLFSTLSPVIFKKYIK